MVVVIGVGRPWAFATAKAQTIGAEELIALVAPDGKLICILATAQLVKDAYAGLG